jgi:mRNA interferase RelE/StbE
MNYRIEIKTKARKFIEKQNPEQQIRILKAIYKIPDGDIKRLKGQNGLYRLRVGDYRIIYSMDNNRLVIMIMNIGNRGDIYNAL